MTCKHGNLEAECSFCFNEGQIPVDAYFDERRKQRFPYGNIQKYRERQPADKDWRDKMIQDQGLDDE